MVEYRINYSKRGFQYNGETDKIEVGLPQETYEQLTEEERIEYITDSLTHEFLHYLLHKEFNRTVCHLFDYIGDNLVNKKLHKKVVNLNNHIKNNQKGRIRLWSEGLKINKKCIINYYFIKERELQYARFLCNHRGDN